MIDDSGVERLAPREQVRTFALITLGAVGFCLLLEAHHRQPSVLSSLLVVYGIHVALTSLVLIGIHSPAGMRHADQLALLLALGQALNLLLYFYCSPEYPGLIATTLNALLMTGTILFSWTHRRALAVSSVTCTGFALVGYLVIADGGQAVGVWLALAGLLIGGAIAVVCALVLGRFRASLARRQAELGALSARLMSAHEEERRRLSRELHDELGQSLTAVSSYLWLIERQLPAHLAAIRSRTADARRLVTKTLGEMRELSQLLRPPVLDLYGLVPSLDAHLKTFGERYQITTSFRAQGLPERLPVEIETAIYRITQEALTNVARHARASRVSVNVTAEPDGLWLEVEDDGVGLQKAQEQVSGGGTGLTGIGERVRSLGGTVTIRSGPGTNLRVSIPVRAEAALGRGVCIDAVPGPYEKKRIDQGIKEKAV